MPLYKFGRLAPGMWLDPGGDPPDERVDIEHRHDHVYEWQRTTGPARLYIAPRERHVALLTDLAAVWADQSPTWLLYVLAVPRSGREPGRYQSPEPLRYQELIEFLVRHQAFLEQDGRHHLWLKQADGPGQVIYDRHNVLFAYGPLEVYEGILSRHGIVPGTVEFPSPHVHLYHPELDGAEAALLAEFDWRVTPLHEDDAD